MMRKKHGNEGDINRRTEAGIMRSAKYKQADFDAGGWVVLARWAELGRAGLAPGWAWFAARDRYSRCSSCPSVCGQERCHGAAASLAAAPAGLPSMPALLP